MASGPQSASMAGALQEVASDAEVLCGNSANLFRTVLGLSTRATVPHGQQAVRGTPPFSVSALTDFVCLK